ncbi:MAG: MFS transporter [Planctomycetota bacterium]|nr:MFS transporter [Planctomycetota bacterium]
MATAPVETLGPSSEQPTRVRWGMFVLACGSSWFLYLHRYTWNVIGPYLAEDYGLSKTELGAIFTFFTPTYGVGQIPSGILCDWVGPHLFLGVIIVIWSLVVPLYGVAGGRPGLIALRLVFGAAQAGTYPALSKITGTWFPVKTRTIVQGWVATFFGRSGGAMSSILLASVLIGYFEMQWQWALVVMGAAGVIFGITFLVFFRNSPEVDPRVNQAERDLIAEGSPPADPSAPPVLPLRVAIRNRSMFFFVIQQITSAGADAVYVLFMGDYFLNAKGFDISEAGLLISLPLWGGAIGGMLGGFFNDLMIQWTGSRRIGRSAVGFTGKFIACFLMFVAISQDDGVAAAWALFAVKFFTDWSQPTVWGTCTDIGGRYAATVFGVINTSGSIGGLVSPILFGAILDWNTSSMVIDGVTKSVTNYNPMFVTVAVMYGISAMCWILTDCTDSLESRLAPGGDLSSGSPDDDSSVENDGDELGV